MNQEIVYRPYEKYCADEILPLYEAVGWTNYTGNPDMLEAAYRRSLYTLGAYDGDRLVGIVRAVGDGASAVLVQDILVLPLYQRQGIGTRLLRCVLERFAHVYQLQLLTDDTPKTKAFYCSLGLEEVAAIGCCAFIRM